MPTTAFVPRPGPTGHGPAVLVAFAAMLCLRAVLLIQGRGAGLSPWAPAADLAAALMLALAAPWLVRPAAVRLTAAAVCGFAYFAAGEHLYTHTSLFRLAHVGQAADADFLAATLISPGSLFLPLYAGLAYIWLLALRRVTPARDARPARRLAAALALLAGYYLATPTPTLPANNVLLSALVQVPGAAWRSVPREAEPDLGADDDAGDPAFFLREDPAAGAPARPRPDVLLVLVESLSAAYLPSVAAHHGLAPEIALPGLDALLAERDFTVYRNPLSLQRQTNRGTYPILCGDYPKIVTAVPKMTVATGHEADLDCLPRLLADAGYATAYIQAAPLSFMNKNEFMPQAGFQQLTGRESFARRGIPAEGWGPGDGDFFAAARQEIRGLEAGDRPWFATLLNVGTHHPYQSTYSTDARAARERAFRDMTAALSRFLAGLDADGTLRDAWVIVASDEAGGFRRHGGRELVLDHNFGMLAVRPPDRGPRPALADRDAIVAQVDIPVTILDLLGLSDRGNMVGRSLLAAGKNGTRGLLFGDTYRARSYFLYEDGRLTDCDETLVRCRQWRFEPDRLFGSLRPADTEPPLTLEGRTALSADASVIRSLGVATADSYRLAPGQITTGRPYRGGQHLSVAAGDRLTLTLAGRVVAADPPAGAGELRIELRDDRDGGVMAERRIRLTRPEVNERLTVTVSRGRAAANVTIHWRPERAGDSLVLQELRLEMDDS